MPELLLVRHAQASLGADDYDRLSELGHRQAHWLGEYFGQRGYRFDRVVCGGMLRHRETADGIFRGMERGFADAETDLCWNEFDFESLIQAYLEQHPGEAPAAGAPVRSFMRLLRAAMQAWTEDRIEAALPERWADFETRVRQGLNALAAKPGQARRMMVISSGGAISMALRLVLQAPPHTMLHMSLQMRNSGVSQVFLSGGSMHFAGFNHIPHLDQPERADSITYY
jgi:broad specificity phosphatase PhoE